MVIEFSRVGMYEELTHSRCINLLLEEQDEDQRAASASKHTENQTALI